MLLIFLVVFDIEDAAIASNFAAMGLRTHLIVPAILVARPRIAKSVTSVAVRDAALLCRRIRKGHSVFRRAFLC